MCPSLSSCQVWELTRVTAILTTPFHPPSPPPGHLRMRLGLHRPLFHRLRRGLNRRSQPTPWKESERRNRPRKQPARTSLRRPPPRPHRSSLAHPIIRKVGSFRFYPYNECVLSQIINLVITISILIGLPNVNFSCEIMPKPHP